MSLYDIISKVPYSDESFGDSGQSPERLGETLKKNLMYTECDDTYIHLYNEFNNYSFELTISPKSSERLRRSACTACGCAGKLKELHEQYDIMMQLIEELICKFKINILGTVEKYKDNKNLHCHCIINNQTENKKNNIKKYIRTFYNLNNMNIVNLNPIKSRENYRKYLLKEPYGEYFYYNEGNDKNITEIERIVLEKTTKRNKKCKCKVIECKYCKTIGGDLE